MTLTLSNLPQELDEALQRRAQSEGKTVDQVALEAIRAGLGLESGVIAKRDLSEFAGSWIADPQVDSALRDQDRVDPELWK
jgi:plasmid stability protein